MGERAQSGIDQLSTVVVKLSDEMKKKGLGDLAYS